MLCSLIAAVIHAQAEQLPADLYHAAATDRGKDNSTVDVHYKLNIPPHYFKGAPTPTYDAVMTTLHGTNVWKDPRLPKHIKHLGITGSAEPDGSPLKHGILHRLLWTVQPRCFLEVGVFRGSTSTHVAKFMDSDPSLADSFVISLDTWLHDARFVWPAELKESVPTYMNNNVELAGSSQMYFTFLANVLATNTSHRIVPLQSASTNGAMALLAHRIRPNLMYIDASHANPDVFVDYENFFSVLAPGGVMAVDDVELVPAVRQAFEALCRRYNLTAVRKGNQAFVKKPRSLVDKGLSV